MTSKGMQTNEWTREKRYRRLEEVSAEELEQLQNKVASSPWRQSFHIQPPTGLLNDPNGFSYYNGAYHVFYQWFPLGPVHGLKYWFHTKSKDLVHWEDVGVGISPTEDYESHGVFSGSAIKKDELLYLMYTGNKRDTSWNRYATQCMAVMDKDGEITKFKEPVIKEVPTGYTDHFRDPMIVKQNDTFYALIGAQRQDETGCIALYKSNDLNEWNFHGELKTALHSFGFMWECPGYVEMDQKGLLYFSPQGLEPDGEAFKNIYQSGYVVGDELNMEVATFHHGPFKEFDHGFDFYAPQVIQDETGRTLLIGWMGLPELAYPTDAHGWAHCLTVPRELSFRDHQLIQQPVRELTQLRGDKQVAELYLNSESQTPVDLKGRVFEMLVEFDMEEAEEVGVAFRKSDEEQTIFKYNKTKETLVLDRSQSGKAVAVDYGTTRKCSYELNQTHLIRCHFFVDESSVEVFIDDGAAVFTARIFPDETSEGISFYAKGEARVKVDKWDL